MAYEPGRIPMEYVRSDFFLAFSVQHSTRSAEMGETKPVSPVRYGTRYMHAGISAHVRSM